MWSGDGKEGWEKLAEILLRASLLERKPAQRAIHYQMLPFMSIHVEKILTEKDELRRERRDLHRRICTFLMQRCEFLLFTDVQAAGGSKRTSEIMEELLHYETNIWAVINRALDKKAHEILDEDCEEETATRPTAEMKHTGTLTFSGQPVAPTNLRLPGDYSFDQLLEQANDRDKGSKSLRIPRMGLKSILHDGNMMEAIGEEDDCSRRATKDSVGLAA